MGNGATAPIRLAPDLRREIMKIGNIEFELRDVLVATPVLGIAVAISWDFGRSTAYGGFTLFSVSEHVLGALAALPIALALVMLFPVLIAWTDQNSPKPPASRPPPGALARFVAFAFIFFLCTALAIFGLFIHFAIIVIAASTIFALVTLALLTQNTTILLWPMLISGCLLWTIAAGNDFARVEMNAVIANPERADVIETKSGEKRGHVLMSGERGVLMFQPETNEVMLVRWDEIKSIRWKRLSVFSLLVEHHSN